ncbi:hypothetical protein FQN51_006162 [Onygenales sp. PD_10]|nr:hypothetical protein FQN51_006162 [Onygenales sp. PD_10]
MVTPSHAASASAQQPDLPMNLQAIKCVVTLRNIGREDALEEVNQLHAMGISHAEICTLPADELHQAINKVQAQALAKEKA